MVSYVIVGTNPADKAIHAGPIAWDGVTKLGLPSTEMAMDEATALNQGYTYPPLSIADVNAASLRTKAAAALAQNIAYLAITSPTNAQVSAQVTLLTREATALIRLLLTITDTTSGS